MVDVLPDQLTFVSADAGNGGGCQYEPLPQTPADDDQVRCSWDILDVGDSTTATLVFAVPQALTGTLVNTATATSSATDPSPAIATTPALPITTSADLSATKSLLSGSPIAGEEVRWQVTVRNAGPSVARTVRLSDAAPAGVTFSSAEVVEAGECTVAPTTIGCALDDLAVGATITVTLNGQLAEDFTGDELTNSAVVASATPDPDTRNNTGTTTTPTSALADLSVTKSAAPTTATAGQDLTWTIRVANSGPSQATAVVISDALPDGVTLVAPPTLDVPGSCQLGETLTCTVPTLASGAAAELTVVARVAAGSPGTALSNTATARSSVADPDPLDNAATSTVPVATSADLALTKTGPADVVAGSPITWQLTLANSGPSNANAVVTDDLPDGVTGISGTFDGGSCAVVEGSLSCPVGSLAAGDNVIITVTGTVDAATTVTALTNQATVASSTPDPDADDRTATSTTAVTRAADLQVSKSAGTETFVAGEPVIWTVTVVNAGPSTARDVVISDALPAAVENPASPTEGCDLAGQNFTCTIGTLAPGTSASVTVTGTLAAGYAEATLVNTAEVTSSTPLISTDDDDATLTTDVATSADLSVGKAITSGPPIAGDPIDFTIVVTNDGPSDAADVVVTDTVPAQVGALTTTSPGCTITGGTLTCTVGTVAAGAQVTIQLAGVVGQDVGDEVTNTASVTSATDDPDPTDNEGSATTTVGESAEVEVTKTGPATATAGDEVSWTMTVTNNGPSIARSVALDDPIPDGVTDLEVDSPAGIECTDDVTCSLGDLQPAQSVAITITGTVDPTYRSAVLTNKATVSSPTADPDSTNASAATSTDITRSADLAVGKSSNPEVLTPGRDSTYTLTVSNAGPSTATDVRVTDELPEGLTLRGAGPTVNPGSCDVIGRTISCTLTGLAPGTTATIEIPVTLEASATATAVTNTATVSSGTPDPDSGNNQTSLISRIEGRADLTLKKTGPDEVVAGTPLAWQLTLTNAGPSDAQDVVITDDLPAGVGTVFASASQGTCEQTGSTVTCRIGVLGAGDDVTVLLGTVAELDPSFDPGEITNTATVTSPTPDENENGDDDDDTGRRSQATTDVLVSADVHVIKTPISTTALAGGEVAWRLTVVNDGPSTARDVVVEDPAVAGLDGFGVNAPAGVECDDDTRCTIGTLAPGADEAVVFTVTATLPDDYDDDTVTNTATAAGSTDDPDPGNNRATSPILVGRSTGVSIVKSPVEDPVSPGGEVSWVIRVRNAGPSQATGVVVSDLIPTGLTDIEVAAPEGVSCDGTTTLTCTVGSMGVGPAEDVLITITGTLDPDYLGGSLSNSASVSSTSPDPDLADNTSISTVDVIAEADLSITKTGPVEAVAGASISWTVTVTNDGLATARNVVVTDTVPAGVTGAVAVPVGAAPWTCATTGSTIRCEIDTVAPDTTVSLTITGTVDPGLTAASLSNQASVSSATSDPDPDDNVSDPVNTRIGQSADLSITKTVTPEPIQAGQPAVFTLQVRNTGPSTARRVTVTDDVPAGMTIGAVTTDAGACAVTGQLVACDLGDLAPDGPEPVEITIPVAVSPDLDPDAYNNTATVVSETPDPALTNNSDSTSGDTATVADLRVTKTADVEQASPGSRITWTISVTNNGPATARNIRVSDLVPSAVTLDDIDTDGLDCDPIGTVPVTCTIATLAVDADPQVITMTGTVDPDATDATIVNAVTVSSSLTADDEPGNNVASATTDLVAGADISIAKNATTATVVAGGDVGWTLTVRNDGPATARDVRLVDPLPATVTAATAPVGCDIAEGAVVCDLGDLPVGAERVVTVLGRLDPAATGDLTNTAQVASATNDPDTADNTAAATTPIRPVADLAVTKTVDDAAPEVGDLIRYTIVVTNSGPSQAAGVQVQEQWPATLDLVAAAPSQGAYNPAAGLWTVGDLTVQGRAELVLTGRVVDDGEAQNRVTVTSATTDPDASDDQATVTVAAVQFPPPTTPPTPPPPTDPTDPGSGSTVGSLPNTGGPSLMLALIGLLAVLAGGRLLRRPRQRS